MHAYLIPGLRLTPQAVVNLVRAIPPGRWDQAVEPGRFTLREAIAHLADWEPIFRERIQAGLEQDGATILGMDEEVRAIEQGYRDWDVLETLERFAREREATIRMLEGLTSAQWDRKVIHNERGEMSTRDQANLILGHDLYHLEHLTQYLAGDDRIASVW